MIKRNPPLIWYLGGLLFLFWNGYLLYGQQPNADFKSVLTVNSDNDAFVFWENRDRYYTYGIGASISFRAEKLVGLEKWMAEKEAFFITTTVRIEGYTPTNKFVTMPQLQGDSIVEFDRPFAGLLYGTLETTYSFKRSFLRTGILIGIMGPSSGAGRLQRWIHDNVTQDGVFDAWQFQIPDQLLLNLSGAYYYDFTPRAKWFDLYGSAEARIGNLYIDASPGIGFRLGRFNGLGQTVSLGNGLNAGSGDWELYIRSTFSATLAAFNGTAQGNLFGPEFEYAVQELNPLYFGMTHGLYIAYKRVVLGFDHFFTYGEVVKNQRHIYARLEFKYRF
ncbi:MAG: lipid A-modifier LpxR family protein [Flavobacteriaceae bacterium]